MKAANNDASVCGVRKFCQQILSGLIIATIGATSYAGTFSWTGGGGANANWSNPGNWGFVGTPANGDTLIFPGGSANLVNTNDFVGLIIGQIRFAGAGGGYQIWGNAFTITNGIFGTNTSGNNSISLTNLVTIANSDLNVTVGSGVALVIASGLTGPFGLVKNGAGTLNLQGPVSSAYTGTTLINQGVLQTQKAASPPAQAIPGLVIIGDGTDSATLQNIFSNETSTNANVTINSNGVWNLGSTSDSMNTNLTLNGNGTVTNGGVALSPNATVTANPGGLQNCLIAGSLNVNSGVCNLIDNDANSIGGFFDLQANISGSATINKQGTGFLGFSGANTFTGQLNVLAGTLAANSSLALGSTNAGTTVSNTAQLWVRFSITNEPLTIASTGTGLLNASGANTWLVTNITLAAQTTIEVDGASLNLQAVLSGPGGFTKTGLGTLTLAGNGEGTYLGPTAVNSGVLQLNQSGLFHAIGASSGITIGDGIGGPNADVIRYMNIANGNQILTGIPITITKSGLMDLNGSTDDVGPIYMDAGNITTGTGTLELLTPPLVTLSTTNGPSSISGNLLLQGGGIDNFIISNDLTVSASISGIASETLTKIGQGNLFLTASNSYAGVTAVDEGWVWAENNFALGSTNGGTFVSNNATLVVPAGVGITNESLTLSGAGEPGFAALDCEFGGIGTWAGPVTLNATSTFGDFGGGTLNVIGPISGPGGIDQIAGGTIFFGGSTANTYGGVTTVNVGTLLLGKTISNGAIPGNVVVNLGATLRLGASEQIANAANVTVNNGGLFDFSTFNESIDTLSGKGNVTFGTLGYLNIGGNGGTSAFNGVMSGIGYTGGYTVGKVGAGTFTMNGNNTYQNGSDVFQGTLIINGTQPQSPVRRLNSGATLGGIGVVGNIGDAPFNATGRIAPGIAGSPAILTCSNLSFTSAGNFTVMLDGPNPGAGYDQLVVTGTNNLGNASLTLLPNFIQPAALGQQFTIINNQNASPIVGTFNGLPNNSFISASGYNFQINYNGGSGNDVVLTLVSSTVTLNSVAKGWYDSTGFHDPGNPNYLSGEDNAVSNTNFFRNFFVFNAPVSSGDIIYAELIINDYGVSSPQGQETYVVRGVTTPIGALEAGGSGLTNIYLDLGSNSVYGERNVFTNESQQFAIIPLNVKFINDITAAAGGQIALGGSLVSLSLVNNHNEFVFGGSGFGANDAQLRLTYGNSVTLNAASLGWYKNPGDHTGGNSNYFAGTSGALTYHDFFVFNLPIISGPLANAQLLVSNYTIVSTTNSNPYQLYDVSTPITTLTNSNAGAVGIFNDLGSGVTYGGRDIFVNEANLQAGIPLDSQFISAVYANSGGQLALGGANTTTNGYQFSFSQGNSTDAQLWLGFLNVPATTPVFVNSTNIGGGKIQYTLFGTSGTSNEIQGSFDFTNWDYIGDLFMTNTTSAFIYTNNPTFPYRFFRARITP
jgi:autotransporter-associated beta strand protein